MPSVFYQIFFCMWTKFLRTLELCYQSMYCHLGSLTFIYDIYIYYGCANNCLRRPREGRHVEILLLPFLYFQWILRLTKCIGLQHWTNIVDSCHECGVGVDLTIAAIGLVVMMMVCFVSEKLSWVDTSLTFYACSKYNAQFPFLMR